MNPDSEALENRMNPVCEVLQDAWERQVTPDPAKLIRAARQQFEERHCKHCGKPLSPLATALEIIDGLIHEFVCCECAYLKPCTHLERGDNDEP